MDINMAVHELLESIGCSGSGDAFTTTFKKILEDYVPRSEFLALVKRVEVLEKLIIAAPWEAEFTMKYDGANSIRLSDVLTDTQLFSINDENTCGPDADGHFRNIAVYLITDDGKSILLPWGTYGDVNEESVAELREAGVNYLPAGLYYLNGEGVLQCNIQRDAHFKIARLATPIAN